MAQSEDLCKNLRIENEFFLNQIEMLKKEVEGLKRPRSTERDRMLGMSDLGKPSGGNNALFMTSTMYEPVPTPMPHPQPILMHDMMAMDDMTRRSNASYSPTRKSNVGKASQGPQGSGKLAGGRRAVSSSQ